MSDHDVLKEMEQDRAEYLKLIEQNESGSVMSRCDSSALLLQWRSRVAVLEHEIINLRNRLQRDR
jgi:hypothetical protein